MEPRVLIVSNRLPVTIKTLHGEMKVVPSAGGLATGLRGFHQAGETLWIGWPGDHSALDDSMLAQLQRELDSLRAVPVFLDKEEISSFYEGFSNSVLWPLFHFTPERLPLDMSTDWESFRAVNEKFADCVAELYRPGDLIWVHDYQLVLLPGALRRRLPHAAIGFFLHIPFPPSELFRILPYRKEILHGMLGADVIGFHTYSYLRHFSFALIRILGLEMDIDHVSYESRQVRLGAFPLGVDPQMFLKLAESPRVIKEMEQIRSENAGRRLLLGVDRLDYIKGIPRRLLAFEELLKDHPSLRGQVRLVQVIVPSRTSVESYEKYRKQIDEMVGRINGAYATVNTVPIHHMHRSIPEWQLVALYRAADVMLVTSTRDGMNLVAKEFVASRIDEKGVLVLSEFTGASAELGEAVQINPYDVVGTAGAIRKALDMPIAEQKMRMRALRRRVLSFTTRDWAESFAREILHAREVNRVRESQVAFEGNMTELLTQAKRAEYLVFLPDYDGTLVPFAATPDLAAPDPALLELLARLAARPRSSIHVVSGRKREVLEAWLGELPISLHAEHGFWSRKDPASPWVPWRDPSAAWKTRLMPVLQRYTANTPGSLIEEKTASLAWHYRVADPEFGPRQARELRVYIAEMFSNAPVEVLMGDKVVEVREAGLNKGVILPLVLEGLESPYQLLAIGDDRTDEDLFRALPPGSLAVHVGLGETRASYRLQDYQAVRQFLEQFL